MPRSWHSKYWSFLPLLFSRTQTCRPFHSFGPLILVPLVPFTKNVVDAGCMQSASLSPSQGAPVQSW